MNTRKLLYVILAISAVILLLPFVYHPTAPASTKIGLPWDIQVQASGHSQVFGIDLEVSKLQQATDALGVRPQVAVIAAADQAGSLEAYFEKVTAGFVGGRILLSLEQAPAQLLVMQKRAVKIEPQESGNRRYTLTDEDMSAANQAVVQGVTFIPDARLEEAVVLERFGQPAEKLTVAETTHYLYPAKGLDVVLNAKGRAALQYVSPLRFAARIRTPLNAPTR